MPNQCVLHPGISTLVHCVLLIEGAEPILTLTVILRQFFQGLPPLPFNGLFDLGRSRRDAAIKRFGTHVQPVTVREVSLRERYNNARLHSRIRKDVDRNLDSVLVESFLNVESPQ